MIRRWRVYTTPIHEVSSLRLVLAFPQSLYPKVHEAVFTAFSLSWS